MPIRAAVMGTLALVAIVTAGVIGVTTSTAPSELACDFVGVGSSETPRPRRTPTDAAASYAAALMAVDPDAIVARGGVVDVTGSAALGDEPIPGTVFAVREQGRTIAFSTVHRDRGGWDIGNIYMC